MVINFSKSIRITMSPRNVQFNREDIVDAAFQIVKASGWAGFSVQAVGKAIKASTMPIYSHFSNSRELEDAVCLKALELLKERMPVERTGDLWIDLAINYVRFAVEEPFLYRCMWDGRNIELMRAMGKDLNVFVSDTLVDYPLFAGLSVLVRDMIKYSRTFFVQRLADWLNKDSNYMSEKGIDVDTFIMMTSKALFEGYLLQFGGEEGTSGNRKMDIIQSRIRYSACR
jgi:AcrR family transcriptional regulator